MLRHSGLSVVLAVLALAPAAGAALSAPRTTVPDVFVTIQVTITDNRISLDRRSANRGDEARFVIRNLGKQRHSFTLGKTARSGTYQTGFSRKLAPGAEATLVLFLDYRGRVPYRSVLPRDVGKPGMRGYFTIH